MLISQLKLWYWCCNLGEDIDVIISMKEGIDGRMSNKWVLMIPFLIRNMVVVYTKEMLGHSLNE